MPRGTLDVIGTLVRLGLAAVWLVSGTLKALDPIQTYVAVAGYDVLPNDLVAPIATVLPWVELAFGALLLVGIGVQAVAGLSFALLLVFVAGMAQAWARGLAIDCGCFGGGGAVASDRTAYVQELLRDVGFLVLAGWLVVRPRTLGALDNRITERTSG